MSAQGVSFEEHELLALTLLDGEVGDPADMEEAIRRIIISVPKGTDIALLLLLATVHAQDRRLGGESSPASLVALNPWAGAGQSQQSRPGSPPAMIGRCVGSV